MPFKINISDKGKAWKVEAEIPGLVGKSIADAVSGKLIKPELEGYELKITGGTDFAGFPMSEKFEGIGLNRAVLKRGFAMKSPIKGLRKRKSIRGKTIAEKVTVQINMIVTKEGSKKLAEVFPEQNKSPDAPAAEEKPVSSPQGADEARENSLEQNDKGKVGKETDKVSLQSKSESDTSPTPTETLKETPTTEESKTEEVKKEEKPMSEETKEEIAEEIAEEVKEEIKEDIPTSPETPNKDEKEDAAEKVAEEVKEESEEVAEDIADAEEKKE